ncbi:uncharacterized protein BcabD6B2_05870 [Babesia caballi]|uniref:Uncharacterized protein n=1 Tax=Babesia caballi TaxID=5871 RepID=A0AAV4LNH3_BABCB|nr:hypothetical protein, conserved [Babesia caballi]
MKMSSGKSLTTPPKDLKEAIDWVLRVTGEDGMTGSSTVSLLQELEKLDGIKNAKIIGINLQSSITGLASGLKTFIGYEKGHQKKWKVGSNGVGKPGEVELRQLKTQGQNVYVSAYYGSAWFTDVSSNDTSNAKKKSCVQNFLTAILKIFQGLTELYYNCRNAWKNDNLSGSNDALKKFMNDNGFRNTQLNTSMTGNRIISQTFQNLTEFQNAYTAVSTNPSLDTFRYQLQKNAWSNPSNCPLSALYILATPAYSKTSITTSKASIATLGATALAGGAYGLNIGGFATSLNSFFGFT